MPDSGPRSAVRCRAGSGAGVDQCGPGPGAFRVGCPQCADRVVQGERRGSGAGECRAGARAWWKAAAAFAAKASPTSHSVATDCV